MPLYILLRDKGNEEVDWAARGGGYGRHIDCLASFLHHDLSFILVDNNLSTALGRGLVWSPQLSATHICLPPQKKILKDVYLDEKVTRLFSPLNDTGVGLTYARSGDIYI